jgi:Response regulator containing CheY-like receiver domain and AraC-type DNA-binding domain
MKVMIVDDEYYFKQAMRVIIPWEDLGFEIVGEAKNGEDALKKLGELKPEIVLVDINMPVMDGLEFIRNVKEKDNDIKFIILTGYNEFNYARQALQLCVDNYLLKPIEEEELKKALFDARDAIIRESNIKLELDSLKNQVRESIPLQREMLLNKLIRDSYINCDELMKKAEYLGLTLDYKFFRALVIRVDQDSAGMQSEDDRQMSRFAVSNVAGEVLPKTFSINTFSDSNDNICVIMCWNNEECDEFGIKNVCERIREIVFRHLNRNITIGIGNTCNEIKMVSTSYREALYALKNRITSADNNVILYSEVNETGLLTHCYTMDHRNKLLMEMRVGNIDGVMEIIGGIMKELGSGKAQHNLVFMTCMDLISTCVEFMAETRNNFYDLFRNKFNPFETIQSKNSLDELETWIKDIFMQTVNLMHGNKSKRYTKIVEDVKKYILDNYTREELRLDEIASSVYVNYTHLCFVFKKETNITINDFLTEVRIKKAKELIDNGNHVLFDVAEKVGYADSNYFSKCFKKRYGIPPTKYIENIKET